MKAVIQRHCFSHPYSQFLHSAIRKSKRSSNSLLFHKYHLYMKTIFYLYISILVPLF